MKKYRYLLFDLDGTLTYSHPGIYACVEYALKTLKKAPPTEEQKKLVIGPPMHYSMTKVFGLSEEEAKTAIALYRERYGKIGLFENEPIPGAKELLQAVKAAGYQTALATSKPALYANAIAEKFGFTPYLDIPAIATFEHCDKSWVVGETLRRFQAQKNECLMIGDRDHDILGAREHGVDCAAVRCGYANEGELERAGAKYIFDDLASLQEFLVNE